MKITSLREELRGYPGRGVFALRFSETEPSLFGYFITGRSLASQQRIGVWNGETLSIRSTRSHEVDDPLRHYLAATKTESSFIIGNGEQVTDISQQMQVGTGFDAAGTRLRFEPDDPIFTPRITLNVTHASAFEFVSHTALVVAGAPIPQRRHYLIESPEPGALYMMTTYNGPKDAVQTAGTLKVINTDATEVSEVTTTIWDTLDAELRVLLVAFSAENGCLQKVAGLGAVVDEDEAVHQNLRAD
ncbi:MAG: IMP cyclohydrolase [Rhodoglobus sp.]